MEQRDEESGGPVLDPRHRVALAACAAAGGLAVGCGILVVALRIANEQAEPIGENWRLVTFLFVGLADAVAGTALLTRTDRRLLGASFLVAGLAATLTAVAIQYGWYLDVRGDAGHRRLATADDWTIPLGAGALAGLATWQVVPAAWRRRRWFHVVWATTAAAVVVSTATAAVDAPGSVQRAATWIVAGSASGAVVALAVAWWRQRSRHDPLPGWLLAGAVAAWIAIVPRILDVAEWRWSGRDVVYAALLLSTVPLLVAGAVVDAIREVPSRYHGVSHRVLEWTILAAGIAVVYAGVVAGLGRLVGGSAPTWFLVAASGLIALVLEPARHRVRLLVDHLIYGARDDPLAVVQRVVDHLGADSGDDLLPSLVQSLATELRLDAVAIDLRVPGGWQRAATTGPLTAHRRAVELHHRGDVVGRLVVGWKDGPSLRQRDEEVLDQLVGPLSLAVGWVRLASDLRRSSVAIVSAREEERRRLRRDLHDGIGPALTGVSLGLRTAVRQLDRAPESTVPSRVLLGRVADEVDAVVAELKRIARDLRPTALDQLGLLGAVSEFTHRVGDHLEMHVVLPPGPVELPAAVEVATYRIVTEAVTNVVRHAGAARCWLTIATGSAVEIDVVDDGVGIAADATTGVGLTAMRERAAELGGTVRLLANDPCGTRVHVRLPAALP